MDMHFLKNGLPKVRFWLFWVLGCFILLNITETQASALETEDIADLSIEDLLNIEVTSVSKKSQTLSNAAAAIYVVTNEDIKRSGASNIPDALRMVPGLNVARIDANKWAITSRGFNGRVANKLLVLIDGRSVYTPSFSGVYWETQDTMLSDIDRIEVIRGPGATLWGANAVNGVINIITKHTADTQGAQISVGSGTEERVFGSLRFGHSIGEKSFGRVYLKGFKRDEFNLLEGGNSNDGWDTLRGGFRVDSQPTQADTLTLQGDIYHANINQLLDFPILTPPFRTLVTDSAQTSGWNFLSKWHHTISPTSDYDLQLYYDHTDRKEFFETERTETIDIEFQHRFLFTKRNDILWGLGYRLILDDLHGLKNISITESKRDTQLFSGFVQDEITLIDDHLWFTIGSKLEHNDFTGFEVQPNARLMWSPNAQHKIWAAISRAVRTPTRAEHDVDTTLGVIPPTSANNPGPFPVRVQATNSADYDSEHLLAYELGYRFLPSKTLSFDLAMFFNQYNRLRSNNPDKTLFGNGYVEQTLPFGNENSGEIYGTELTAIWHPKDWWRMELAYSFLKTNLTSNNNQNTQLTPNTDPQHQVSFRSSFNITNTVNFDVWLRYVDEISTVSTTRLETQPVPAYTTLDVRLAWQPVKSLEFSIVGQNLLDSNHLETVQETWGLPTEVPRGIYSKLSLNF